jgi:hypothetical protein
MTWLGSRQTRAAREDLRAAEDAEAEHVTNCIACTRAVRQRVPADRCADGKALLAEKRAADKRWREERKLDKAVPPGQQALW